MTDPQNGAPNMGVATSVQTGPDGKPWGIVQFQTPLMHTAIMFPTVDGVESLAAGLPKMLRDLAAELKRQQTGLTVASMDVTKLLRKDN